MKEKNLTPPPTRKPQKETHDKHGIQRAHETQCPQHYSNFYDFEFKAQSDITRNQRKWLVNVTNSSEYSWISNTMATIIPPIRKLVPSNSSLWNPSWYKTSLGSHHQQHLGKMNSSLGRNNPRRLESQGGSSNTSPSTYQDLSQFTPSTNQSELRSTSTISA